MKLQISEDSELGGLTVLEFSEHHPTMPNFWHTLNQNGLALLRSTQDVVWKLIGKSITL